VATAIEPFQKHISVSPFWRQIWKLLKLIKMNVTFIHSFIRGGGWQWPTAWPTAAPVLVFRRAFQPTASAEA